MLLDVGVVEITRKRTCATYSYYQKWRPLYGSALVKFFTLLIIFRQHQALATWMDPVTPTTQYGVVRLGVATYIFREIWVARSRATFE